LSKPNKPRPQRKILPFLSLNVGFGDPNVYPKSSWYLTLIRNQGFPGIPWQCFLSQPRPHDVLILIIEGSLEVKLPTICTDEKQSRGEAERRGRLEERR
jgi:hypothetical protein